MKSASIAVLAVLMVSASLVKNASGQECKEFVKSMIMDQMKFVVPCIKKLGLDSPADKKEKVMCILKCVMIDAKMLAPDGGIDMDLAMKMFDTLPPAIKEKAQPVLSECSHHAASLDKSEATCQSYTPLLTCLTEVAIRMCE